MKCEVRRAKSEFRVRSAKAAPLHSSSKFALRTSHFALSRRVLVAVTITLALLAPEVAQACAVCYGPPNSPMVKSADNATLFLLGTVGFVQICFIALFWTLWRRARALRRHREQFHVIHGGVR